MLNIPELQKVFAQEFAAFMQAFGEAHGVQVSLRLPKFQQDILIREEAANPDGIQLIAVFAQINQQQDSSEEG